MRDFFEHQERARRRTGLLVLLFVIAVICIMVMVYVAVAAIVVWYDSRDYSSILDPSRSELSIWDWRLIAAVGGGTILIVAFGSLWKVFELRAGGSAVAEMLGGRIVERSATDLDERKILNVVEEMAIASGTPVPPVYVMEKERAINAFAAGWSPGGAVIGVTRGAIEKLSRDELQGVIAHEFSHILNGDMRLNIRLIGILHGILVIGLTGYTILRSMRYVAYSSSSSRRKGGGGAAVLAILAIGLALIVIGFVGVFFGKIIKSAVSRQREYLADAAAVQFTRYPAGIGGALKKIAASSLGAIITSPRAEEASHMYFGQGIGVTIPFLFATHPPIKDRIRRVEPDWDGTLPKMFREKEVPQQPEYLARERTERNVELVRAVGAAALLASDAVAQIGNPTQAHMDYAASLVEGLPAAFRDATRDPYAARAVVYALVLNEDDAAREAQWSRLESLEDESLVALTRSLASVRDHLDPNARLPLLDMALPSLRELSQRQYEVFRRHVDALIAADNRLDLFEWMLQRLMHQHLDPSFKRIPAPIVQYYSLARLGPDCACLLSALAHAGHRDDNAARRAFNAGARRLESVGGMTLMPPEACSVEQLEAALSKLVQVSPPNKRRLLEACAATIAADREVKPREAELLRGIADALNCPMPPILPGQPLI